MFDSVMIEARMDAALKAEWTKLRDCPGKRDMLPDYDVAQGWGFVIAGYFLVEQSFKWVLARRFGRQPDRTHILADLYAQMPRDDREVLKEFYRDALATIPYTHPFPIRDLEPFLANLDGGGGKGSLDWRYFLLGESETHGLPTVAISLLHELAYGCRSIVRHMRKDDWHPLRYTHSWRIRWDRNDKHMDWLAYRMNTPGWDQIGDRLEILWGPDYKGRHDYMVFRGDRINSYFAPLPDEKLGVPLKDMRAELESFDADKGYPGSRLRGFKTSRREIPRHGHVMF